MKLPIGPSIAALITLILSLIGSKHPHIATAILMNIIVYLGLILLKSYLVLNQKETLYQISHELIYHLLHQQHNSTIYQTFKTHGFTPIEESAISYIAQQHPKTFKIFGIPQQKELIEILKQDTLPILTILTTQNSTTLEQEFFNR